MTAPSRAYTPGTDVIDITAPGGLEQLLAFHRATFGDAVMRANLDGDPVDDDPDDDEDPVDDDPDDDDGDPADDVDPDDDEGREQLGDKGQKALDRMKAKRKADRARIRALEAQLAGKDDAGDGEDGKSRRAPEMTADQKVNRRILRSEIKAAAKGVLADPSDAYQFLNLDQFEVDENGDVDEDEIADALDELVKKKPYLAAQGGRRFKGSAGGGAGKQSRTKQLTEADIDRLTPEQIVEARRKGQLDGLLKGTR